MTSSQKNRLRAKYFCPPELEILIENYNHAPLFKHPNIEEVAKMRTENERKDSGNAFAFITSVDVFEELFPMLPARLQAHLWNKLEEFLDYPGDDVDPSELINIYQDYVSECTLMREFIRTRPLIRGDEYVSSTMLDLESVTISVPLKFTHDGEGRRRMEGLVGLIGTFDNRRLRLCKAVDCGRAFWAKRQNSETCSTTCYENLRQMRSRQNYQNGREAEIAERLFG